MQAGEDFYKAAHEALYAKIAEFAREKELSTGLVFDAMRKLGREPLCFNDFSKKDKARIVEKANILKKLAFRSDKKTAGKARD